MCEEDRIYKSIKYFYNKKSGQVVVQYIISKKDVRKLRKLEVHTTCLIWHWWNTKIM